MIFGRKGKRIVNKQLKQLEPRRLNAEVVKVCVGLIEKPKNSFEKRNSTVGLP